MLELIDATGNVSGNATDKVGHMTRAVKNELWRQTWASESP